MLLGIISKQYNIQGINITKAITIGSSIVQQKDINWSKRIRGNDALAHINIKIIIQDFTPNITPLKIPSNKGSNITLSFSAMKEAKLSEVYGLAREIVANGSNNRIEYRAGIILFTK